MVSSSHVIAIWFAIAAPSVAMQLSMHTDNQRASEASLPDYITDCGGGWFSKNDGSTINARAVCESMGYTAIDMFGGNYGSLCSNSTSGWPATCAWTDGPTCGTTVDWHCTQVCESFKTPETCPSNRCGWIGSTCQAVCRFGVLRWDSEYSSVIYWDSAEGTPKWWNWYEWKTRPGQSQSDFDALPEATKVQIETKTGDPGLLARTGAWSCLPRYGDLCPHEVVVAGGDPIEIKIDPNYYVSDICPCPEGEEITDPADCAAAACVFHEEWNVMKSDNQWPNHVKGCTKRTGPIDVGFWFNKDPTGACDPHAWVKPVCKAGR